MYGPGYYPQFNRRYPSYGYPYPQYVFPDYGNSIIDSQISNINQSLYNAGVMAGVSQVANSNNFGGLSHGWY
jgi:hypothetical protein